MRSPRQNWGAFPQLPCWTWNDARRLWPYATAHEFWPPWATLTIRVDVLEVSVGIVQDSTECGSNVSCVGKQLNSRIIRTKRHGWLSRRTLWGIYALLFHSLFGLGEWKWRRKRPDLFVPLRCIRKASTDRTWQTRQPWHSFPNRLLLRWSGLVRFTWSRLNCQE